MQETRQVQDGAGSRRERGSAFLTACEEGGHGWERLREGGWHVVSGFHHRPWAAFGDEEVAWGRMWSTAESAGRLPACDSVKEATGLPARLLVLTECHLLPGPAPRPAWA